MNLVSLLGRLVKDPEIKTTQGGKSFCKFTLAVNRYVNGKNDADFINCVAWGATAENLAKYQTKGSQIALEGNIKTSSYEDSNGRRVYTTDVWVEKIHYLAKVESSNNNQANTSYQKPNANQEHFKKQDKDNPFEGIPEFNVSNEDLPF